jgi:hypothetical protein
MAKKVNSIQLDPTTTYKRDSIESPEKGLVIFNSDNNRMEINIGDENTANWVSVAGSI